MLEHGFAVNVAVEVEQTERECVGSGEGTRIVIKSEVDEVSVPIAFCLCICFRAFGALDFRIFQHFALRNVIVV